MPVHPLHEGVLARPAQRPGGANTSRRLRAQGLAFLLVALAAGLAAAWLITGYLSRRAAVASRAQMAKVAVAAIDLPLATTLRPEMIELIDWPQGALPPGSFQDAAALEGRVTALALVRGEPLVESRLTRSGAGLGMAAVIPANTRAMTVRVNEVIGVGGFVHPGDIVDVLTTMQAPRDGHSQAELEYRSKIVLQDIKVLAVGEDMVTQNAKPVKVPVVTLLVTPEQSERLALASSHGELQLTMRSQSDHQEVATPGISPPELLGPRSPTEAALAEKEHRAHHHHESSRAPAAAPPPGAQPPEVVEILRGDRFEERKMRTNGKDREAK